MFFELQLYYNMVLPIRSLPCVLKNNYLLLVSIYCLYNRHVQFDQSDVLEYKQSILRQTNNIT